MPPATRTALAVVFFGLLLAAGGCKPAPPPPDAKSPPAKVKRNPAEAKTKPEKVTPKPANPGMPLDPITVPERVDSERNKRPSTFPLRWLETPADGLGAWPPESDWTHVLLESDGTPLHLGLSPELVMGTPDATGDILLTVDGPKQALAITSRFASSWSAKTPAHTHPSAGTLRCSAQSEGFNLERGDTDCFDQQGGGWFSLAVTCPAGKRSARFYLNVNPALQRGEVALSHPSAATLVAAVFAEAWSSP